MRSKVGIVAITLLLGLTANPVMASDDEPGGPFVSFSLAKAGIFSDVNDLEPNPSSPPDGDGWVPFDKRILGVTGGWRFGRFVAMEGAFTRHRNYELCSGKVGPVPSFFPGSNNVGDSAGGLSCLNTGISALWGGGRFILPVNPYVDVYAGMLYGRYTMRTEVSLLEFRFPEYKISEGGYQFKFGVSARLNPLNVGFEVRHFSYTKDLDYLIGALTVGLGF